MWRAVSLKMNALAVSLKMNGLVVSSAKSFSDRKYCDALRDLVPFVQFKKRENTH